MNSKTVPQWIINLVFAIGLISALLFRLLIFFNDKYPSYGRIVWYSAVIGYIIFFGYRYYISQKRRKAIIAHDLAKKISDSNIEPGSRNELLYLIDSLMKSKERINYVFIFSVSLIVIITDILFLS